MIKAIIFDLGGVLVNTPSAMDTETYQKEIKLDKEVLAFALEYKAKGYRISLLSNTIAQHIEILKKFNFFHHFESHVFSYEVQVEKPHPRIYKLALERLDLLPSEAIFIDDMPQFTAAASDLGIHGITFRNLKQVREEVQKLF